MRIPTFTPTVRRLSFLTILALGLLAVPVRSDNKIDPYAANIAPGDPKSPADERKAFRLPPGFEIQLVASEPDIHKPLNMVFDARGRLWVSETVEYPFPTKAEKGRDAVKILEDFGEDGRARKVSTFADGLHIPIGVLPLSVGGKGDSALVYSIPNVCRLTDADGDGKADRREVLYGSYGFADTHGMTNSFTRGFDGWVYACHGFSNTSTVKGADGRPITMSSGNTYRMRPDGSHLEQWTWGQVNPFGLSFDPLGNLYSCDCHTQPVYQLLRGAYYPSFGKPHDGLGFGPEAMSYYPDSTAIAGNAYYAADYYPPAYRDAAYIGDVVTNRVNQFRLEWHGSSPRATKYDFLLCDDQWFRPVAVALGPDGALYIADFYNRIIGHYEVPLTHPGRDRERGRIWRIVCRGADGKLKPLAPVPDLTRTGTHELVADLANPNLTVRMLATNQLVERGTVGAEAVRAVMHPESSPFQRMHGLWVLERTGALDDRALTAAADDIDRGVRVHAQRVLGERPALSPGQRGLVLAALKDPDPLVQRTAADALGRHTSPDNLVPLMDLRRAAAKDDTHLIHVVRMALRDNLRSAEAWQVVAALPCARQDSLADVALGVPTPEAAAFLLEVMNGRAPAGETGVNFVRHVARYGTPKSGEALLALLQKDPAGPPRQFALFRAFEQGTQERGGALSPAARHWATDLAGRLLASEVPNEVTAGVTLAGSLRLSDTQRQLVAIAGSAKAAESQRVAALNSLIAIDPLKHVALLGHIIGDAAEPMGLRVQACVTLGRLNRPEALAQLVAEVPAAPAWLQTIIAGTLLRSREGTDRLLDAVEAGKVSARLLREPAIEPQLALSPIPGVVERVARLTKGLPPADVAMQQLLEKRRVAFAAAKPDAVAGARVFEQHCAACHQVGGKGAKIGPQLDGIGTRGLDRLMEDVLDPNRNVDQAFRLTTLNLTSGQVVSGLLLKEEGEVYVLADQQGKEVHVPKKAVEERTVSPLSPMPANFADQLAPAEFNDLMAFLLEQRAASPPAPGASGR
jgi:putative heme-binding domain-containing protein